MSEPLVSVIIPTYNRFGVICQTIDNVLAQSYRNIEVIVVDDGSKDGTQESLRAFGNRLRVIGQENAGPSAARNRGFDASHGEIIAFQDSDDLWEPTKLERQVALLSKFDKTVPCCVCNAMMRNIYGDGQGHLSFDLALLRPAHEEGLWVNVTEVLASRFVLFNQTVAIRRNAFERVGGFDASLRCLEDLDLALKLSLEGPWAYIRDPLTIWAGGASDSLARKGLKNEIGLKRSELEIFNRILTRVAPGRESASLRRALKSRLRTFRLALKEIELRKSNSRIAQAAAFITGRINQFYCALQIRSPWFPTMAEVSAEGSGMPLREDEPQLLAPRS
jgi:glycosyltransferase involved in cell wall biosynthesis